MGTKEGDVKKLIAEVDAWVEEQTQPHWYVVCVSIEARTFDFGVLAEPRFIILGADVQA